MAGLSQKTCIPCQGGVPTLQGPEIAPLLEQLRDWQVVDEKRLTKTYSFNDFAEALSFVNRVGEVAEREGHHPDIHLSWGRVQVDIWTHKVNGLTESDFILAAKTDEL